MLILSFNDPRKLTIADYDGTPDGKNPEQSPRPGFNNLSNMGYSC